MIEFDGRPAVLEDLAALALYGYGHFTSITIVAGRARGFSLHLDRLVGDCRKLFAADLDRDRVRQLIRRAARQSSLPAVVRVTVYAPDLDLGRPGAHLEPHVLVTTRAASSGRASALRLTGVRYQRDLPEVKHVGLFTTVYHRRVAQLAGSDDVLFLDDTGRVVEGATWNIGFFDGQQVVWPRSACLPGVTMRLLKQALVDSGVPWVEAPVDLYAVAGMQAAFVTNAAVGVRAVRSIDHVGFQADLPFVELLQQRYLAVTEEEI